MKDNYHQLIEKLDAFIRKYYKNQLIRGAIYAFTLTLAFFLIVTTVEYFGHFDSTLRTILFYGFLGVILFILGKYVVTPLMHLQRFGKIISHEQAARIIGTHFSSVQDKLLNVLQLRRQSEQQAGNELLIAGINQKIDELRPVPFVSAINLSENRKYLRYAVIPLAAFFLILFTAPSLFKESTRRLIDHRTYFEKPAPFIFEIMNDELKAVQQQDFRLDVSLKGNEIPAVAFIEIDGNEYRLEKENLTTFHYNFKNIQRNQHFRLFADGHSSPEYILEALPNPLLMNFEVALEYPAYLKKTDETIRNSGDLVIPAGTRATWTFNTQNTDHIRLGFRDTVLELRPTGKNSFRYSRHFRKNDSYMVTTGNKFLDSRDSIRYAVSVIPDLYPTISVEQQADSFSSRRTYFRGLIKDDYGFTKLAFHYKFLKSDDSTGNKGKEWNEILPVSKSLNTDQFFYAWDLATVNISAGDEVEYYFEVWDNDGITGPKSTRSRTQVFKAPSLKEIAEMNEENSESIRNDLKQSAAEARKIQEDLNELSKRLLDKKEMTWEDKKKTEDLLNRQKELEKKLEELRMQNERNNRQQEEFRQVNEDILQKQEQLQAVLEQMKNPELEKLIKELEKLMQNVDKNQLQQQLSEIKLDNKDLQKELERAIELFKQMEFEQKLQDIIDKLNELAEKEEKLSEESAKKDADGTEQKEKQDELNKEFDEFRKEMDELAKKNEALEQKHDLENTDQQEQEIQEEMKNSSDQLGENKPSKASKSQKNASQKMKQMSQKMSAMQQQMQQQQQEEDMNALRALLENLLHLSFDQEKLMQDLKSIDINNPQYLQLSQQQRKLKDDARMIEDSLFALSKRVAQIQAKVNQEISSINHNMQEALGNLEGRMVPQARSRQQFVMTSVNNLTLMLSEALDQMMKQAAAAMPMANCNKPGQKKPSSLSELRKMQEELNKNMQKAKEALKKGEGQKGKSGKEGQGGMSEELAKMAAQQEYIRNQLNKLNQMENKDGRKSLGNLEDIAKQMEQTEKDIVNRMISEQTLKRQQEITTRLLESERAEREREQDEQRKSNEAKNAFHRNPSEFEEYKRLKLKEMELLRTVPPALNSYYKQKVNDYFQSIEK